MTIVDKARAAAEKASEQAKHGLEVGQARLTEAQEKRKYGRLLRQLGEAYYAEHRGETGHEPVVRALAALDAHRQAQSATPPGPTGAVTDRP
jgi:hypothetical protein